MTDGEGAIKNSGLIHKHFTEHKSTYVPSRGRPVFAERIIKSFREMLDKRLKPNQQWTDLAYQKLLTYNNKYIYSATNFTPSHAKRPSHELMTYIHMKLKANNKRKCLDIIIGDNVKIYQKKKLLDKGIKSKWSNASYKNSGITKSHGLSFFKTSARAKDS